MNTETRNRTGLLIDVGNTHTHIGWFAGEQWLGFADIHTKPIQQGELTELQEHCNSYPKPDWAALCSVVPEASKVMETWLSRCKMPQGYRILNSRNVVGIGIDYPAPETIGADRIANSMAAARLHGAPVVVVDFGTAVTFDVVDQKRNYVGGIITPGLSVMTEYLHEKTALLPRIELRDPGKVIGKSTTEAIQVGAVHGYRGMIDALIVHLKTALDVQTLPVVATGGYARLIAGDLDSINDIRPNLTLEGLLLLTPGDA
jgi:type III pantothenate kinase